MRNRNNRVERNGEFGIKPIRSNPFFPGEVKSLSQALGVLWRELATSVNAMVSEPNDVISVVDFGAVGDGVADDTAAIQAALDFAESESTAIYIPAGKYLCSSALTYNNTSAAGTNHMLMPS
jgi:hypothetical protein